MDVRIPDTFTESHLDGTSALAGAAAEHRSKSTTSALAGAAAKHRSKSTTSKYVSITSTHIFTRIAIETAGSWNQEAIEIVEEIGNPITSVTDDPNLLISVNL